MTIYLIQGGPEVYLMEGKSYVLFLWRFIADLKGLERSQIIVIFTISIIFCTQFNGSFVRGKDVGGQMFTGT